MLLGPRQPGQRQLVSRAFARAPPSAAMGRESPDAKRERLRAMREGLAAKFPDKVQLTASGQLSNRSSRSSKRRRRNTRLRLSRLTWALVPRPLQQRARVRCRRKLRRNR